MNLRTLMCVLGAFGALAFSTACEIKEGTGGAGGTGGDDGGTGGMGGTGGGMGGTGGGMGGMGGSGGMMCLMTSCADYITTDPEGTLCEGTSAADAYDKLANCTCELDGNPATMSPCNEACKDSACMDMDQDADCTACLQDTSAMGCGTELNNCANN